MADNLAAGGAGGLPFGMLVDLFKQAVTVPLMAAIEANTAAVQEVRVGIAATTAAVEGARVAIDATAAAVADTRATIVAGDERMEALQHRILQQKASAISDMKTPQMQEMADTANASFCVEVGGGIPADHAVLLESFPPANVRAIPPETSRYHVISAWVNRFLRAHVPGNLRAAPWTKQHGNVVVGDPPSYGRGDIVIGPGVEAAAAAAAAAVADPAAAAMADPAAALVADPAAAAMADPAAAADVADDADPADAAVNVTGLQHALEIKKTDSIGGAQPARQALTYGMGAALKKPVGTRLVVALSDAEEHWVNARIERQRDGLLVTLIVAPEDEGVVSPTAYATLDDIIEAMCVLNQATRGGAHVLARGIAMFANELRAINDAAAVAAAAAAPGALPVALPPGAALPVALPPGAALHAALPPGAAPPAALVPGAAPPAALPGAAPPAALAPGGALQPAQLILRRSPRGHGTAAASAAAAASVGGEVSASTAASSSSSSSSSAVSAAPVVRHRRHEDDADGGGGAGSGGGRTGSIGGGGARGGAGATAPGTPASGFKRRRAGYGATNAAVVERFGLPLSTNSTPERSTGGDGCRLDPWSAAVLELAAKADVYITTSSLVHAAENEMFYIY